MSVSHKLNVAAAALVSTIALFSPARADVIVITVPPFTWDFNVPSVPLVPGVSDEIFVGSFPVFGSLDFVAGTGGGPGVNWVAFGAPQFNADDTADIAQIAPGVSTITINFSVFCVPRCISSNSNITFNSIGLASSTNDRTGGQVGFVFNHADGSFDTSIVTLKPGTSGLQHFSFDEQNISSVNFFAINPEGPLLQFDEIGFSATAAVVVIPGPIAGAGLPGLILACAGLLALARRRRQLVRL